MDYKNLLNDYKFSIKHLAERNSLDYEKTLYHWTRKLKEFDTLTDKYNLKEEIKFFEVNNPNPLIAFTINGSILIISGPDNDFVRSVRYHSIPIRSEVSNNIPEVIHSSLKEDISIGKNIIFTNKLETSNVIAIKTSFNYQWDNFDHVATVIGENIQKKFIDIHKELIKS